MIYNMLSHIYYTYIEKTLYTERETNFSVSYILISYSGGVISDYDIGKHKHIIIYMMWFNEEMFLPVIQIVWDLYHFIFYVNVHK